jgi:hypothetical protein
MLANVFCKGGKTFQKYSLNYEQTCKLEYFLGEGIDEGKLSNSCCILFIH